MKKTELVYRELLFQAIENKQRVGTQLGIAKKLHISLSTVNSAIKPLARIGAIRIKPMAFEVLDIKKALLYWASRRNLEKDIIYTTRVEESIDEIEKSIPPGTIYAAYSAYKRRYKEIPADYSEVYVYGDREALKERFPKKAGPPNLFVLEKDPAIASYGNITTVANTFVDLWNIDTWYAREFVKALEKRLFGE